MGSILLSLKSGITYILSSLTQSLSGLSRMLRATSLLQMLSYIPIHDIFERKRTQTWKWGYISMYFIMCLPLFSQPWNHFCHWQPTIIEMVNFISFLSPPTKSSLAMFFFWKLLWFHSILCQIMDQGHFWRVLFGALIHQIESDFHKTITFISQVENSCKDRNWQY